MLDQVFEKMFSRSFFSMITPSALLYAGGAVLSSALLLICLHALVRTFGGILNYPLLFAISTVSTFPLAVAMAPLTTICVYSRSQREISSSDAFKISWKPMVFLGTLSFAASLIQAVLCFLIILWKALSLVPVVGPMVYLVSSWIPALLCSLMIVTMVIYVGGLFFMGAMAARGDLAADSLKDVASSMSSYWLTRLRLCVVALFPLAAIVALSVIRWRIPHYASYLEFAASLFRVVAFSAVAAPAVVFFSHMAVEAEKYIQWLLTHRTK
jgi:hypothetical protein